VLGWDRARFLMAFDRMVAAWRGAALVNGGSGSVTLALGGTEGRFAPRKEWCV